VSTINNDLMDGAHRVTGRWWLYLISAGVWFVLGFVVLTWNVATVWAVAVLAGVTFITGGLVEFLVAAAVPSWKWVHVVLGIISIAAGVTALAWPGQTFLVLAAVLAWFLLISGMFEIVVSFMTRAEDDLWWLRLVVGLAMVFTGFWAVGYPGRSVSLLVIWVAAGAIARAVSDVFLAFGLHAAGRRLAAASETAEG
jgi:uncharacterized membrane protein HdeD (DUF308 family)